MEKKGDSKVLGRRRTLQLLGVGGLAAGGLLGLGCKKDEGGGGAAGGGSAKPASAGPSCNSAIDDTSKNLRKALQYKDKTDTAEKACSKCLQYTVGTFGDCGGCKLFSGPVQPNGVCASFAPQAGGAAPAKSG